MDATTTSQPADYDSAADSASAITAAAANYADSARHEALGPPPSLLSTSAATTSVSQSQAHSQVQATGTTPLYSPANSPSIVSRAASMSLSTPVINSAPTSTSRRAMDYGNGNDMEVDMDADPFNKQKYARPPSSSRPSSQYLPANASGGDPSASGRAARYSPMNTSPTTYVSSPPQEQQQQVPPSQYSSYTPQQHSARQSPNRQTQNQYASPTQQRYYASPPGSARAHNSQLPPLQAGLSPPGSYHPQSATQQLNAVFGHDSEPQKHQQLAQQQHHHQQMSGMSESVPQFKKVNGPGDLSSHINPQPPFRRANPEGGFISPLQALTTHLPATYRICNPSFQYESSRNPRRVLTKPSKGVKNDGYDNEDSDYILYVNDILGSEETNHKNRYLILDVLGQGTFGQVVKCQNLKTQEVVAVKVIKNKTAYFNQSMMEVSVLDLLNGRMDKNDDHHILRLKDTFIHRQHLCLVFELLSVNLYELIKQNQFRGLSTTLVRVFAQQLLNGLCLLSKAKLIHCDLKPENILLKKYVPALPFKLASANIIQSGESHHQGHRFRLGV